MRASLKTSCRGTKIVSAAAMGGFKERRKRYVRRRLSDIANRYGKDSFQYIKAKSCPNSSLLRGFPSPAI